MNYYPHIPTTTYHPLPFLPHLHMQQQQQQIQQPVIYYVVQQPVPSTSNPQLEQEIAVLKLELTRLKARLDALTGN